MNLWAERLRTRLMERAQERFELPGFRQAAVLVPILDAPGGPELLFTLRSSALTHHAGQIAFPGGRVDPGESLYAAARRETREEIGLEVPEEDILGVLDEHPSPARYVVTPVVALVPWPQPLTLNDAEVEAVFTVSVAELRAIVPRSEERQLQDYRRRIYFYEHPQGLIWGLTGNLVRGLLELLDFGAAPGS